MAEVEKVLRLYRETFSGFNVRHYHGILKREHAVKLSYSFVRQALQGAGLVAKRRARGRHRRRREPRACFGEMLHIDGSPHQWLEMCPGEKQTLIAVVDDATKKVLHAQLWPEETAEAVMVALRDVVQTHGIPMALYSDRAAWAAYTPKAGGGVDKQRLTQVGRVLKRLGIEHIVAYSPQARGRSERMNGTFQGRLVNELRVAQIATPEEANQYLRERFISQFCIPAADPVSAFVSAGPIDLEQIICHEEERGVSADNTVQLKGVRMQIGKQPGRASCARVQVTVRRHLDGTHSVWRGTQCWGRYDTRGKELRSAPPRRPRLGGKASVALRAPSASPPKRAGGTKRSLQLSN
jgi:hypothetical protein